MENLAGAAGTEVACEASAAAARARRSRARKRRGSIVINVELTSLTLDRLVEFGVLSEAARADRSAVRAAFLTFCRQALDQAATAQE